MMNLFETSHFESKPWFVSLVDEVRNSWRDFRNPPVLAAVTATPVDVPEMWSRHKAGVPRLLSALAHVTMVALALFPWALAPKRLPQEMINVALYAPSRIVLPREPMA